MMKRALREFDIFNGESQMDRIFSDPNGFFEPFLKELGATITDSVDATDYEGATHTVDLNEGLPQSMQGQYDAVIDGGTLEHVFNFPVALKGAMETVKEGGRMYIMTQCNNAMGHGFYQFSPELYHRVFSPENGFAVEQMFIAEGSFGKVPWHSVADPKEIRRRVELVNDVQTYLLVIARRVASVPIFATWPQQSDYSLAWQEGTPDANFKPIIESKFDLRDYLPQSFKRLVRLARLLLRPRFAAPCYHPVEPTALERNPPSVGT
ncbi:MAG: hypothetical protein Q8Q59_03660 [Luteolibacter sp.]|jgi:hypothetical protein|nr:hypothetical protein [Luteolibacter sp.]